MDATQTDGFGTNIFHQDSTFLVFNPTCPHPSASWVLALPTPVSQPTLVGVTTIQFVYEPNGTPSDVNTGLFLTLIPDNSSDLGASSPRSGCEGICGSPINLTNGNTWTRQQDYALPGLGGGLSLTRTWNSLWISNSPFQTAGMFGDSWQSNYEERLQSISSSQLKYWRADGSAWTFTYNTSTQTYSLTNPPDERASLVFNSSTTLFTLTLRDGSAETFNNNGYLLSQADRNGNR